MSEPSGRANERADAAERRASQLEAELLSAEARAKEAHVEAARMAAILSPADAALGQAVVSNPRVPIRVRQALNVESGLNDGIMLPVITLLLAVAAAGINPGSGGYWTALAARSVG